MITLDVPKDEVQKNGLRFASLNDIPWIIENAKAEFRDSPYFAFGVDEKKARLLLEKLIVEGQTNYIALISMDEGNPVGCLCAYAFEPLFSKTRIAIEVLWFIDEKYRQSRRGVEMMDAYEYWAKNVGGCKFVQYGLLSSSPQGMERLYDRSGAVKTESIYMKELK